MFTLDLGQLRTTLATGGILSVRLVGQGGVFHVQAETRRGAALLTKARSTQLRAFRSIQKATEMLSELGVREFSVDTKDWHPEQSAGLGVARPDRALQMKQAHEAADLKRTLEARIKAADDPNTVWLSHEEVFATLESLYAD